MMTLYIARDGISPYSGRAWADTFLYSAKPKYDDIGQEWLRRDGSDSIMLSKHHGLKPGEGPVRVKLVREDAKK
jgi:hypothetical protein